MRVIRPCALPANSASCAKRQPASDQASPCTTATRAPPIASTRCIGRAASAARLPACAATARSRARIALLRSTSASGTDSG